MSLVRRTQADEAATPLGKPSNPMREHQLAKIRWRHLCESLIFACPYSTREYLQHLDAYADRTGMTYDRDRAIQRCKTLAIALEATYPDEPSPLKRCHLAVASKTFLICNSHLLPKEPKLPSGGARPQVSEAERMARAEELAASF